MNQPTWKMNGATRLARTASNKARSARSVLECGSPRPHSLRRTAPPAPPQSARGLAHSKTWRSFAAFLALALPCQAQSYSIGWFKIAGGGDTSTGGPMIGVNYSVSGTIGQHDAGGPMTNGPYSVTGGFWALPTLVQTPGAPTLAIALNPQLSTITLSWTPRTLL